MDILSEEAENCTYNNTFFNNTVDHWYITYCERGPQRQPLEVIIPLTIINVFIFVTGILGNIAVCVVIIKHPKLINSATNYYLFNLAVSDLTLLVFGLPNDVAIYWHQYPYTLGEFFCKFRALLSETASYVSVLTIVAFSTERYVAICYPLYLVTMSGLQRPVRIITCLWIIGFLSAIPFAAYTGIDYVHVDVHNVSEKIMESAMCAMVSQPKNFPLIEVSTLVFFIIPMSIIVVQYSKMGITISKNSTVRKNVNGSKSSTKKLQSNRSVIKMLTAVVIGFFLSWAPFHAQRLVTIYLQDNYYFHQIYFWMYIVTGIFYYFSSTLNPILYNVMSDRMREAFKEVLCGIKPKNSSFKMNSTVRETSHGHVPIRNSNNTTNIYLEDEKIQFVKKEQTEMIMMTPIIGNKTYDVEYLQRSNGNSDNDLDETNM